MAPRLGTMALPGGKCQDFFRSHPRNLPDNIWIHLIFTWDVLNIAFLRRFLKWLQLVPTCSWAPSWTLVEGTQEPPFEGERGSSFWPIWMAGPTLDTLDEKFIPKSVGQLLSSQEKGLYIYIYVYICIYIYMYESPICSPVTLVDHRSAQTWQQPHFGSLVRWPNPVLSWPLSPNCHSVRQCWSAGRWSNDTWVVLERDFRGSSYDKIGDLMGNSPVHLVNLRWWTGLIWWGEWYFIKYIRGFPNIISLVENGIPLLGPIWDSDIPQNTFSWNGKVP